MSDTIALTREEVREARRARMGRLCCALILTEKSEDCIVAEEDDAECLLCKKLTEFAEASNEK